MSVVGLTARDRLITATKRVIADHGVAGASSRLISGTAGENLASITYYFGSKDALVTTALIAHVRDLIAPVLAELDTPVPLADKFVRCVVLLNSLFVEHRAELPAYVECLSHANRSPAVSTEIATLFDQLTDHIGGEIVLQQTLGAIPDWVRPDSMARLIVAVANGVIVRAAADSTSTGDEAIAIGQQFIALISAASALTIR